MDQSIDGLILSSFKEYLSHRLCQDLNAYTNRTVQLYSYTAPRFSNKSVYGSAYPSWIYDSSITGATVPSGVGSGTGFWPRGSGSLAIDYKNGRVILNSGVSLTSTSISVSVPDFNIYVTTKSAARIISETKFEVPPVMAAANTYMPPDTVVAPCIFIKYSSSNNEPYCLGGVDETDFNIQVIVFADSLFKLYGVQKIVRDIQNRCFCLLTKSPLNEFNDVKDGYFHYDLWQSALSSQSDLIHITDSTFKILDLDFINERYPNMVVGMGNVKVAKFRQSHDSNDAIFTVPTVYEFSP